MGAMEKQKQSLYFPEDTLQEIMKEATRLDRSLSWTVQQAWRLARENLRKFPTASRIVEEDDRKASPAPGPGRSDSPRAADEVERVRASAQLREFLKGKFDRDLSS
jgi:uncharacterized small protein (TIGR04563 family)